MCGSFRDLMFWGFFTISHTVPKNNPGPESSTPDQLQLHGTSTVGRQLFFWVAVSLSLTDLSDVTASCYVPSFSTVISRLKCIRFMSFSHSKLNKVQEPQLCSHWVPTKSKLHCNKKPQLKHRQLQDLLLPSSFRAPDATSGYHWAPGQVVRTFGTLPDSQTRTTSGGSQWFEGLGSTRPEELWAPRWEGKRIWGWSLWRTFRLGRCRFLYYSYSSWLISTVYCESTLTCESVRIHIAVFMCLAILVMTTVHILSLHKRITDSTDLVCCSHYYILNFWKEIIFSRDVALNSASGWLGDDIGFRTNLVGSIWIPGAWISLNERSRDWMSSMESVIEWGKKWSGEGSMFAFSTGNSLVNFALMLFSCWYHCYTLEPGIFDFGWSYTHRAPNQEINTQSLHAPSPFLPFLLTE